MEDIKIPAKTMSAATDGEQVLKKQIGCMNGILQLFDRHHFITGRRVSSQNHKRMLQGAGRQQGPNNVEKGLEAQKEKPRMSTESSRASCSSSTCSTSTFSSLDCNRTVQPDTFSQRQISTPERPFQITATKERQPPLTKSLQSLDLRDIVKDSMYREGRDLSIKHLATDGKKGTLLKHIDSPRPSQQFKPGKPKATGYERSPIVLVKDKERAKNSKEERLALPRFSYDGRESRETIKWGLKHKELPRLSLDSKSSSHKSSACESRLKFLGKDQHMGNESSSQALPSNQESGSHHRSSSIVAKLMGLETLQDAIFSEESGTPTLSSCPKDALLSTSTANKSRKNQETYSFHAPKGKPNTSSPRLHNANYVRKPPICSKLPLERAPWSQLDHSQGSLKMTSQSRKATASGSIQSSSVYSEIEKRISELDFKQSGKDLRALKQILEAMEKTRERLGNQRGMPEEFTLPVKGSSEDRYSVQKSKLSIWENVQSYHQVHTFKSTCMPMQSSSFDLMVKPEQLVDKANLSIQAHTMEMPQLQRLQTQIPTYHREISAYKQREKHFTPKNNNVKDPSQHRPSPHKKTTWRTSEMKRTSAGPHCMTIENTTDSGRSLGTESPRLQQNPLRIEEQSHPTLLLLDSHGFKKRCSKKLVERSFQNRKQKGREKEKDLQLNDDQLSENSSEARSYQGDIASVKLEGNTSQISQTETEVISLANSTCANARQKEKSASTRRKNILAVENAATLLEQPSPISVLDDTFYNEDSPSPVKKTSTDFQDECTSPGEAERDLKNPKHSTTCRRTDCNCQYNQKLDNMKHSAHELSFLLTEPDKVAATDNALAGGSCNPHHRYITKILLTSGLLKDSNFFSTAHQLLPSCHLINPDIFHVLEQTEGIMDLKGEVTEKGDNMQLNKKLQRRIIFDVVDEILVRKLHSGRYNLGSKIRSPQGLLKEVYLEMDWLCRISDCNSDNAKEAMIRLSTADMLYQSEDWADNSGQLPGLVLDIERKIFKDLIDEVVTGEDTGLRDRPKRYCRKLFSQ